MNRAESAEIAAAVTDAWTHRAPSGPPRPVGSPGSVRLRRVREAVTFVAATAAGRNLVFCFTVDASPREYLLCIDLTDVPSHDPATAARGVTETVAALVDSPDWADDRQQPYRVSPTAMVLAAALA